MSQCVQSVHQLMLVLLGVTGCVDDLQCIVCCAVCSMPCSVQYVIKCAVHHIVCSTVSKILRYSMFFFVFFTGPLLNSLCINSLECAIHCNAHYMA